jgi:very-short-patch-repair endonuclease
MKKKTTEDFIKSAKKIHGNKFNYDHVEYKGAKTPVKITCSNNHIFEQTPNDHLNNHGCKECSGWGQMKFNNTEFLKRIDKIHGDKLIYKNIVYKGHEIPLEIICPKHGVFEKTPKDLLIKKAGCPKCGYEKSTDKRRRSIDDFVKISNKIHNNAYDYSMVDYKRATDKVKIICVYHGIFEQTPKDHTNQKQGCPKCQISKGEKIIKSFLLEHNISFIEQKRFKDCINPSTNRILPFDFFIPSLNLCIEFDGEQHFSPIERFGGLNKFKDIIHRDEIKNEYCKINNIILLRIKYNQIKKINKILEKYVKPFKH